MKLLAVAVLCLSSVAYADDDVALKVVPRGEAPVVAPSLAAVAKQPDVEWYRTKSATFGDVAAEIHKATAHEVRSRLALKTSAGWWFAEGFYTDTPAVRGNCEPDTVRLESESLAAGTLFDGSPAIVYRSVTHHESFDHCATGKGGPTVVHSHREQGVLVCSVAGEVRCGQVDRLICPSTGCQPIRFEHGVLTVVEREHSYLFAPAH